MSPRSEIICFSQTKAANIELDNAGYVRFDGKTKNFKMRDTVIDKKDITFARHWKYNERIPEKPWENFTEIQLEVA